MLDIFFGRDLKKKKRIPTIFVSKFTDWVILLLVATVVWEGTVVRLKLISIELEGNFLIWLSHFNWGAFRISNFKLLLIINHWGTREEMTWGNQIRSVALNINYLFNKNISSNFRVNSVGNGDTEIMYSIKFYALNRIDLPRVRVS